MNGNKTEKDKDKWDEDKTEIWSSRENQTLDLIKNPNSDGFFIFSI